MPIIVRATAPGYYGQLRAEGDKFEIDEPSKETRINPVTGVEETITVDPFAPSWMEKVQAEKSKKGE